MTDTSQKSKMLGSDKPDCDAEIEKIDERIAEELAKITDEKNNDTRLKEYASLEKRLNRDLSQTKKEIAFYEKNHVCPTCSQSIPQDKAESEKAKKNNQVTDFSECSWTNSKRCEQSQKNDKQK